MKIGRNDPCHCGSGKKYKRCHLRFDESGVQNKIQTRKLPPEEAAIIRPLMEAEERRRHPEPYMHIVPSIEFKGKRVRCIWNVVHTRRLEETFHEFLFWVLVQTLGEEWWNQHKESPEVKRHVVFKWFIAVRKWMAANRTEDRKMSDGQYAMESSGHSQSLLQLSYDVFCLQQVNKLPDKLLARLRNNNEFQGARYEIGVAAMFAGAGFEIEFLDGVHGQKICEFIARHKSGLTIAVEAKSRHRTGVLNFKGTPSLDVKADIGKLYGDARKKKPTMPFVIFIDANMPPTPDIPWDELPWLQDIKRSFGAFPTPTPEKPDPHNAVLITNYTSYYEGDEKSKIQPPLYIFSLFPTYPKTHPEAWDALWKTVERYTYIPKEI